MPLVWFAVPSILNTVSPPFHHCHVPKIRLQEAPDEVSRELMVVPFE
jgi:hypothetical protein